MMEVVVGGQEEAAEWAALPVATTVVGLDLMLERAQAATVP